MNLTTEAIFLTITSSLLSGIIGVFVSFYFYQRLERRKLKIETARKLFGGKHNMAGSKFQEAMNEVMLVFSDSSSVISAMDELWITLQTPKDKLSSAVADDKMVKLMKAICRDIGIKHKDLPDAYFLRYLSVPDLKLQPTSGQTRLS